MSDSAIPDVEPLPPIPPLPANSCVLAVRPAADKAHTFLRLTYDVTHLSEDAQKLMVFMLTNALTELEKGLKGMNRIEIAAKLAQRERISAMKGNGSAGKS